MRSRRADPLTELREHIEALGASDLRELLLGVTADLAPTRCARLVDAAARKVVESRGRGALAPSRDPALAGDVAAFTRLTTRNGSADPSTLDNLFARLSAVWTHGQHEVFRNAVLGIAGVLESGVELGHDELYSEVLATDLDEIASRCLVAVYTTTAARDRPKAIADAIASLEVLDVLLDRPIDMMERTALEPLVGLDEFARAWAALLRKQLARPSPYHGTKSLEQRLREATIRSAGATGLAELARSSKSRDDFEAWARALLGSGDARAALLAAREGARSVARRSHRTDLWTLAARIEFGRGKSGESDLLEALREEPNALRMRRWIATVSKKKRRAAIRELDLAIDHDAALGAMLAALRGDWDRVAALMKSGAALGWSAPDHAGHPAVDATVWALAGDGPRSGIAALAQQSSRVPGQDDPGASIEEDLARDDGLDPLVAPSLMELLAELRPTRPDPQRERTLRDALAQTALARTAAVVEHGRRSRYDAAARLLALAASLHDQAGQGEAAGEVIARARAIAGRKWSLTQAIDAAVARSRKTAPLR